VAKIVLEKDILLDIILRLKMNIPKINLEEYDNFKMQLDELELYINQSPIDKNYKLPQISIRRL
jgi:hypothetical protein